MDNQDKINFGNRLRKIRIEKGHSNIEKFAFDNDFSRVLYSRWESGDGNITFKNIVKVTKALDVTLKDFFSEGF